MFPTRGLPLTFSADKGPWFSSNDIRDYFKENGMKQHSFSKYCLQEKGEVERQTYYIEFQSV